MMAAFERVVSQIEDVGMSVSIVAIFLMMVLVTSNAFSRYLFNNPFPGVVAIVSMFLMVSIVFLSLGKLQRNEGNIAVRFFYEKLSPKTKVIIKGGYLTIILFILLLILAAGADVALENWARRTTSSGIIQIPTYYSWFIYVIGLTILCIRIAYQTITTLASLLPER